MKSSPRSKDNLSLLFAEHSNRQRLKILAMKVRIQRLIKMYRKKSPSYDLCIDLYNDLEELSNSLK